MSPILFTFYLNDLEEFLINKNINGAICDFETDEVCIYFKLLILLYADDTVLFSDNSDDLQHALNIFEEYCNSWKLKINISKTKIVVFGRGKLKRNMHFTFQQHDIEIVDEYKYLGVYLGRSGSFIAAKKHVAEQANKALFSLLKKIRSLSLPYDIQIDLFNKMIKPILLYGCEIWGTGNVDILERVQLKFYKQIFCLKKSTPSYMIYGELGITPLYVDIQTRLISFWCKLVENYEACRLSSIVYNAVYVLQQHKQIKSQWIDTVKNTLCSQGFSGIWYSQSFISSIWLEKAITQKLKDVFIQNWTSQLNASSCSNIYKTFKTNFEQSKYVSILPTVPCKWFMRFRTRNHRLPVEVGRWHSVPLNERKCMYCNIDIGDEFHYLLVCNHFKTERSKYLKTYFYTRPNILKFEQLMNLKDEGDLRSLCKFISIITKHVSL